jgi:hypothetical protein
VKDLPRFIASEKKRNIYTVYSYTRGNEDDLRQNLFKIAQQNKMQLLTGLDNIWQAPT